MSVASNSTSDKVKRRVSINGSRLISLVALQGLLLGACGYLTYQFAVIPVQQANAIAAKSYVVAKQQQQVNEIASETRNQLSVVAQRMGILAARMNRIDALGQRLASSANFDEFDFSVVPSVGGPEQYEQLSDNSELSALFNQMDQLLQHLDNQQQQLSVLETVMLSHHIEEDARVTGLPVQKGWLSSHYGMRSDPFTGRASMHRGVDIASPEGTFVIATGAGVVSWAAERAGYGFLVEIDHGAGLKTRYAHAKKLLVKIGDVVGKGDEIALVGSTGRSTGPHVHYEVIKGDRTINPRRYLYASR